ncbi:MAG: bifunctional phosphopantothenoylcysteine decarboxylase/phosphopantothenate--cysteine ligase CoaBC [Gammaproteobacteria bacterium]|nr:bifunctional phosphopantothenoylcysteine decarboxylase/phosphopantothenate--cysteine ligase CoaBC [Gammaproteobacteria bacterium]
MNLIGKKIVLGICGGIAAYKTPILVRRLRQAGAEVQVVMTRAATSFVTPTSIAAVSGRAPRDDLFDLQAEASMGHIELARWADCVLIAPATAHLLGQLAGGLASDLLTTLCLATRCPVMLFPAMNNVMWESRPVQANVQRLSEFGYHIFQPDSGEQACGETGPGRLPEPEDITPHVISFLNTSRMLAGLRVLITAGPTREAIDPVRFISNHSSGKQGYAFAEAALDLGADVTLVSGPVALPPPKGAHVIQVQSAEQMLSAVLSKLNSTDVFIGVAAVADYRPKEVHEQKIKRVEQGLDAIPLVANPDIIATVASSPHRPRLVIGFAAETQNTIANAEAKLIRKKLDAIIVNDVADKRIGFNGDNNAATLITATGRKFFDQRPKHWLARDLLLELSSRLTGGLAPTNPLYP